MKRELLVGALDLGSTKTCAIIAEAAGDAKTPKVRVLGVVSPQGGNFEVEPPEDIPVLGDFEGEIEGVTNRPGPDLFLVKSQGPVTGFLVSFLLSNDG